MASSRNCSLKTPSQCAILCGGLGTRLGHLTAHTPKPLLPVNGKPFLEILLFELGRQGFREVLLLAGFESEKIAGYARSSEAARRFSIDIQVSVEPTPAGTAGALFYARDLLQEDFYLINGDTWFDIPLLSLATAQSDRQHQVLGVMALRHVTDAKRYGTVHLKDNEVVGFEEKSQSSSEAYINGGVYLLSKRILDSIEPASSLENDVLPLLAKKGALLATKFEQSFFLDIGIPETYLLAQTLVSKAQIRPAAFLDRDGVINVDAGHVGTIERFEFIPGAPDAIRKLNNAGYYVFVVTNQAGIAKGYYSEADHLALMAHMSEQLRTMGAHIDDHRYCPYHPAALDDRYRADHPWRKPGAGMLHDLMSHWQVDLERSFLIGDMPHDLEAASRARVKGFRFEERNLLEFIDKLPIW